MIEKDKLPLPESNPFIRRPVRLSDNASSQEQAEMPPSDTIAQAELIARAWDPIGWTWYDNAKPDHITRPTFYADQIKRATAVMKQLNSQRSTETTQDSKL